MEGLQRLGDIYIGKRLEASAKAPVVQASDIGKRHVNKGLDTKVVVVHISKVTLASAN